jgi:hypothetical protein
LVGDISPSNINTHDSMSKSESFVYRNCMGDTVS